MILRVLYFFFELLLCLQSSGISVEDPDPELFMLSGSDPSPEKEFHERPDPELTATLSDT
jgi:hypothetical protein